MENLIKNAEWNVQKDGAPLYFKKTAPIKFESFQLFGSRTCSLTMSDGVASECFDDFIDVKNKSSLMFGLTVKAETLSDMFYVIEYFDEKKRPLTVGTKNVRESVSDYFSDVFVKADIPENTAYIRIRWDFKGKIKNAVFFNPRLYAE